MEGAHRRGGGQARMASRAFSRNFLVGSVVVCVLLFTKAAVPPSTGQNRQQSGRPVLSSLSPARLLPRRSSLSGQTPRSGSYGRSRLLEEELTSNQSRTGVHSVPSAASNATQSLIQPQEQLGTSELRSHVACPAASLPTRDDQCTYVRGHPECQSDSELGYATFFFCTCRRFRILGFIVLVLWLACLFFMLGNTAADYFCPALEELSSILRLPPTVAGVTLLPLGNGAPDVFSSVASFVGAQQGEVGLNSVLGAASFVICVVAGSVCVAVSRRPGTFKVDRVSFVRDISFFLITLLVLLVITFIGKLNLFGAMAFFSLYIVYGASVAYIEMQRHQQKAGAPSPFAATPGTAVQLQPLLSGGLLQPSAALLPSAADAAETLTAHNLPQWMWIRKLKTYKVQLSHPHMPHTASADRYLGATSRSRSMSHRIEARGSRSAGSGRGTFPRFQSDSSAGDGLPPEDSLRGGSFAAAAAVAVAVVDSKRQAAGGSLEHEEEGPLVPPQYSSEPAEGASGDGEEEVDEGLMWGWEDEEEEEPAAWNTPSGFMEYFIKLPLTVPRMLTVPVHSKGSWSRLWFTTSCTIMPSFALLVVWGARAGLLAWALCAGVGVALGLLAFATSTSTNPPTRFVLLWVVCGFSMSMLWFYAIANELVALLVTFGTILEIDTAVLGLTVLAWGNSIGDFVANLALVQSGGPSRVQIAWSGCFAGPLFNILVGLGISMVLSTWNTFPAAFTMPSDPALPWLLVFLCSVLGGVLVWLPSSDMKLHKTLGIALIASYCVFIGLRILHIVGVHLFGIT